MEYSSSGQMEKQTESEKKEVVTEEEINDGYITVANAGDRKEPSEKETIRKDSVKDEISTTKTDGTEGQRVIHVVKKLASGDTEHDSGTILLPDMPLPPSLCQHSTTEKKDEVKTSEFKDDAPVGMSVSPLSNKVPVVSASSVHSTPPFKFANKAKRLDTIVSNLIKMKNNGSAAVRIESTRTATIASAETGDIEHSMRESGSEQRDEGCSPGDAAVNGIGFSRQHHVDANPYDAKDGNHGGQFACLDCSAVFETDAAFKQHIASHDGYRRFKCTVCEKRLTTKQSLMVHMRGHTGEKPFGCNVCDKKFTTNGQLTVHERTHTGDKPFECLTCHKRFTQSGVLHKHNLIHTGERPFKCDICDKMFTTNGKLTVHKRIHTGERLYKCDTCEKKFTNSSHLVEHTRIHTGEKPFVCDVCKKCFSRSGTLIAHKRIHIGERPFVCPTCQKRFARSGDLYRHTLCHTGEKPLQCEKGFTRPAHLKEHQRIHTAQKSSKCDICNKRYVHCMTCGECFNSYIDYNRHRRRQHKGPDAGSQPDILHLQHLPTSSPHSDASRESSPMEQFIISD